ncbi:MAG TPA: hypothetical protein PL033_09545 [Candidatus Brocadiia bacterium]|nr:hypothetical protein [Candidatus Brocadiia bacterium]
MADDKKNGEASGAVVGRRRGRLRRLLIVLGASTLVIFIALAALVVSLQMAEEKADFNTIEAAKVSMGATSLVVPGPGIPFATAMPSNNNLDICRFRDRFYCAFRSAPTHFASTETRLRVMSSADAETWEREAEFAYGCDIREPRFLVFKDKLFLYFFTAGKNMLSFTPDFIHATEFKSAGDWAVPRKVFEKGYVVWRARAIADRALMTVYDGLSLYRDTTVKSRVRMLESDDGYDFRPFSERDISNEASASEADFELDDDGTLYGTIRMEFRGSMVCRAPKGEIGNWTGRFSPNKYDSALVFKRANDIYVIARRNVAGTFNRDCSFLPERLQAAWYLTRYSLTRKRTCLYKLDKDNLELLPLFDLPSCGDTAYAGIVPLDDKRYLVFNYSSDIDGFDWPWLGGQLFGSNIYYTELEFR